MMGHQFEAIGEAQISSSRAYYDSGKTAMVREGIAAKVVMDDEVGEGRSDNTYVLDTFWEDIPDRNGMAGKDLNEVLQQAELLGDEDGEEAPKIEPNRVELPIWPYVRVFDLDKHQYVVLHTMNVKDYPWDKQLIDKLVIKDTDKKLISILMNQTGAKMEDIIRGKMGGVIVLATGVPGIGKTLTAEVFSEEIERPLYTVQCSQLGLDVKQIEANLQEILNRAAKWNAILLIDEADVYIRKRGDDIHQNAIVGVFLRLIEYYRGILFMTSNRGDSIDDAIISRASAWIKYEVPDANLLGQIWEVLGAQYGATFTKQEVKQLVSQFEGVSGRTVRNILKLARMIAGDEKITVDQVIEVSRYQMVEGRDDAPATLAAKK
jgi:AAA+ superfamily predicted ATPase